MTATPLTSRLTGAVRLCVGALRRRLRPESPWETQSFSQEGEDLVLKRIFEGRDAGFYVDVGAHHPMRFSNTYIFYKAGWRGINIDATPGSMAPFRAVRPRDINVEIAISDRPETLSYYTFHEPALNTFSKELAQSRQTDSGYPLKSTVEVRAEPLADVLARSLPPDQRIDFLTVDAEGWDLKILQSNDWERFRPTVVVTEALRQDLVTIQAGELVAFLRSKGYELFAKTFNSLILRQS